MGKLCFLLGSPNLFLSPNIYNKKKKRKLIGGGGKGILNIEYSHFNITVHKSQCFVFVDKKDGYLRKNRRRERERERPEVVGAVVGMCKGWGFPE